MKRNSKLLERTLQLLAQRPRTITYQVIEKQTGLPASWLQNIAAGVTDDPGVCRVETLYRFLSGRVLPLD